MIELMILKVCYFPMLKYTSRVFGIIGLVVSLYTHQIDYLIYALLLSLPVNIVVTLIYVIYFAKF